MFEYIKKVVYERQQSLFQKETFLVENCENKYILKYSDIYEKKGYTTKEIRKDLIEEYFDKLFRLISEWKNNYEDTKNIIVDGTYWKLKIEYMDGKEENYIGIDKFPSNFEYLDEIKYELINNIGE